MTDHNLTADDLRHAHEWAREFARRYDHGEYVPERDRVAARAILAHVPDPGPAKLTKWSDDLAGTWAEDTNHGVVGIMLRGVHGRVETYFPDRGCTAPRLSDLAPRPDLAPVDLTPRPVQEPETTPRTVTTADEYAALPEGSIVAKLGGRALTLVVKGWYDSLGRGSYTHDSMAVATRTVLREGWGA